MSNDLVIYRELPTAQHAGAKFAVERINKIASLVPPGVSPLQFVAEAIIAANQLDASVDPTSVAVAIMNAATAGIRLGKQLGQGYLVPFKNQVQLIIGYKGFLELGYASGWLSNVTCEAVLAGENYRRWNSAKGPQIEHELPADREVEWDALTATYCIYRTTKGETGIVTVGRKALEKLYRAASPKSVWKSDPVAMALKTPIRRASKLWKQTDRIAAARYLDELAERNEPQPALVPDAEPSPSPMSLDDIPDEPTPDAGPTKLDELRDLVKIAETPFEVDNAISTVHAAAERGDITMLEQGQLIRELETKTKNRRKA